MVMFGWNHSLDPCSGNFCTYVSEQVAEFNFRMSALTFEEDYVRLSRTQAGKASPGFSLCLQARLAGGEGKHGFMD